MKKKNLLLHLLNCIALIIWCSLLILLMIIIKNNFIYLLIIFVILSLIAFSVFYLLDYKKKHFYFITLILFANSLNLISLWVSFILIKNNKISTNNENDNLKASWELKSSDNLKVEEELKELRKLFDDYSLFVYNTVKNNSMFETNSYTIYENAQKALLSHIFINDYLKTQTLYSIEQLKQASNDDLKIALKQVWKKAK